MSREELAAALVEISEGKVPGDFRVLQELHREMTTWPGLDEDATPGVREVTSLPCMVWLRLGCTPSLGPPSFLAQAREM